MLAACHLAPFLPRCRADACSTCIQVATCIAQLLQAYAYQQSFSAEAKGGGPESNMRLLLALVALGRYFVSCASPDDLQVS